ncbi:MAG: dienelactone hydrolase family protein [Halieaceae bacterium]|jgi:dienelactone hydrolase|nr:dienelactone hydrolase family protein [Halieaceae bacterium]
MAIQTRLIEYTHEDETLEAFMAWDDAVSGPRPGVLVSHAFRGREQFECDRARQLAEMGYVGFALDLFGKDVVAETKEQAFALMGRFTDDRALLRRRLAACVEVARAQDEIDADRLAAIGYCFGGLCVLDMARTGLPLAGVCSFHGILAGTEQDGTAPISSKILVEHGWDDPMVKPEAVLEFAAEMDASKADWQLHAHGGAVHAFTNPGADDPDFGTVYDADADRRSWQSLANFLEELFGA